MPKRNQTYQYQVGDDPVQLAAANGITVQELLTANPGGAPFSTGQTIRLPPPKRTPAGTQGYQYRPPTAPAWMPPLNIGYNWKPDQYRSQLQQGYAQGGGYGLRNAAAGIAGDIAVEGLNTLGQAGNFAFGTANAIENQVTRQYKNLYGLPSQQAINTLGFIPGMSGLAAGLVNSQALLAGTRGGRTVNGPGQSPGLNSYLNNYYANRYGPNAPAPAGYGTDDSWYRTDGPPKVWQGSGPQGPQTPGLSPQQQAETDFANTRAAQYNAANNIPFLNQLRWDPQRRKYITVGKFLKQSKRQSRNDRQARAKREQRQVTEQNYALANSIIDLGVSAG